MTGTLAKGELSLSQLKEMLLYLSVFKSMCGDLEARADVQRVITSAKAQLQVQARSVPR